VAKERGIPVEHIKLSSLQPDDLMGEVLPIESQKALSEHYDDTAQETSEQEAVEDQNYESIDPYTERNR
jgi:hypothetical protein